MEPGELFECACGRGTVVVAAFKRDTSLLIRRIGDMGHHTAADWRCVDCVADMAQEVAGSAAPDRHPDFAQPTACVPGTSEGES